MKKAELVAEALPTCPPVTNLYRCGDRHIAVTVVDPDSMARIFTGMNTVPLSPSHIQRNVAAFLADETGTFIDYDGNPANGMTPILASNSKSFATTIVPALATSDNPYADALAALGYQLADE